MAKRATPWPRCTAPKKSGEPCGTVVETDPATGGPAEHGFCSHHAANPVELDDAPSLMEDEADVAPVLDDSPATTERIGSLRAALREGASTTETAKLIEDLILDALRASKDHYATCVHCRKRTPVSLPDLGTRVKAAETLLNQLEGRLADGKAPQGDRIAELMRAIEHDITSATDEELLEYLALTKAAAE